MHVHIASILNTSAPIKRGISAAGDVDKVYLLIEKERVYKPGKEENAVQAAIDYCEESGYEYESVPIDPYNYMDTILAIKTIYNDNYTNKTKFTINITGGTKIQAAAACVAAHFISAEMIYIAHREDRPMSENIVRLPAPPKVAPDDLSEEEREILQLIMELDVPKVNVTNKMIAEKRYSSDEYKAKTSYHLRRLEGKGLIKYEDRSVKTISSSQRKRKKNPDEDKRSKPIHLTEIGEIYAKWLK